MIKHFKNHLKVCPFSFELKTVFTTNYDHFSLIIFDDFYLDIFRQQFLFWTYLKGIWFRSYHTTRQHANYWCIRLRSGWLWWFDRWNENRYWESIFLKTSCDLWNVGTIYNVRFLIFSARIAGALVCIFSEMESAEIFTGT